jgi:hypothetical protein
MPAFLRKIHRPRWYREESAALLAAGDVPADVFVDLRTQKNSLSVWEIQDDRSNFESVVAAYASTQNSFANFDYALFDCARLQSIGVAAMLAPGETKDEDANREWHYDLVDLSGHKLLQLAILIFDETTERARVSEMQVKAFVAQAISNGRLKAGALHENMQKKLPSRA